MYVAEMACNIGFLLYLLTSEKPKNLRLPDEYCNESGFSQIERFGKNNAIWVHLEQPQHLVVSPFASNG